MPYLPPPVNLPGFHRATSVDLCGLDLFLSAAADPPASCCMFPALEALSLSGCHVDAAALLLHCPRLRVLRAAGCSLGHAIRSASLQELVLENKRKSTGRVHVDVPALKQLTLSINTPGELRLSISAPIVEKVLWRCCYSKPAAGIGPWGLAMVRLETAENNAGLSLRMESDDSSLGSFSFPQTELSLAQEIEEHLVLTNFSVLDLHFNTTGHAFGAFVFRLLRIHWIRTATKILKIEMGAKGKACPVNCPCDEPGNWRSETTPLINLQEVEIRDFGGEDHEFDFLRLILKCAPRLKRMTMRPSHEVTSSNDDWNAKIYDILKVYPSVGCNVFPN
uniref:FBD domain-containing protein n=1 Tax=Aegilops tauschii subsp. strangulata TaxID=200361 RepID=A0A453J400_AEGTS